jgi:hypothetical protein
MDRYDKVWVRAQVAEAPNENGEVLVRIEGRQTNLDNNLEVALADVISDANATGIRRVCEAALDWAGEYGFRDHDGAQAVFESVERLCPDMAKKFQEG